MLFSFSGVVSVVSLIWLGGLTFLFVRLLKTFSKLTKGVTEKDLRTILEEILKEIGKQKEVSADLGKKIDYEYWLFKEIANG